MKNYYQILNVSPNATEESIKRSYRVLAKRYHPDVNPGDAAAADKFADINEANSVLSDPKARAEYDAKLKESQSARLNPEDVIARQRAQAQAAARQAARSAGYNRAGAGGAASGMRYDPSAIARARAAQAQAQAMRQAQAQFQSAQVQAQFQAIRDQAFKSGREQGIIEGQVKADGEITKLNATIRTLTAENKRCKKAQEEVTSLRRQMAEAEQDRRELEQELFNRDRELSQEKIRAKEIEDQLQALRESDSSRLAEAHRATAENSQLREMLDKAQQAIKKLEQDKKQAEQDKAKIEQNYARLEKDKKQNDLNTQAQVQLQLEKRRQLQVEVESLKREIAGMNIEMEELRAENDQWQQYAKSEEFISDTERRLEEWSKKTQADRRLAKPTLYGTLGVLIWATDAQIDEAYKKLKKRYSGKSDESIKAKLQKVEDAYAVLSDPAKREAYNTSINITADRIAEERRLIVENESLTEEYRNRLASKEFWAHYDELTAAALEGDANAQNTLGEMNYYGDDIEQDLEQAVFWFKEAAKQKHADAMYSLGICFVNGEGTERNEATGNGFIRQAAKLGSKAATQYLNSSSKKPRVGGRSDDD